MADTTEPVTHPATVQLIDHLTAEVARLRAELAAVAERERRQWLAVARLTNAAGTYDAAMRQADDAGSTNGLDNRADEANREVQAAYELLGGLVHLTPAEG